MLGGDNITTHANYEIIEKFKIKDKNYEICKNKKNDKTVVLEIDENNKIKIMKNDFDDDLVFNIKPSKKNKKIQFPYDKFCKFVFKNNIRGCNIVFKLNLEFEEFIDTETIDYLLKTPRADLVILSKNDKITLIEFQKSKMEKKDKRRFGNYQTNLHNFYNGKEVIVFVISLDPNEIGGEVPYGYNNEYGFTMHVILLTDYNASEVINIIRNKIRINEINEIDIVLLHFLPFMKSDKSQKELLRMAIELTNQIRDLKEEKILELKLTQTLLAQEFFDEKELDEVLEMIRMEDEYLINEVLEVVFQNRINNAFKEGTKQVAKNMLRLNQPIKLISKYTNLSEKEIKNIAKNI